MHDKRTLLSFGAAFWVMYAERTAAGTAAVAAQCCRVAWQQQQRPRLHWEQCVSYPAGS